VFGTARLCALAHGDCGVAVAETAAACAPRVHARKLSGVRQSSRTRYVCRVVRSPRSIIQTSIAARKSGESRRVSDLSTANDANVQRLTSTESEKQIAEAPCASRTDHTTTFLTLLLTSKLASV
jgi:hypothetical protein